MDQHNTTVENLARAFRTFGKLDWHHKAVVGYKPSEVWVLFALKQGSKSEPPAMKVSEISKMLRVTSPTITQLLKDLEAHDLVERKSDPADRRAVYISLTEKGQTVIQQAGESFIETFSGLVAYLGEERSNQLAELLNDVSVYFREKEAGSELLTLERR